MTFERRTLLLAALLVLASSCRSVQRSPDLGALYNPSIQAQGSQRRPVIVIPGTLGSRLVDETTGQVVWGVLGESGVKPRQPEGARLAALPMRIGASLDALRDQVVPDGVLDRIRFEVAGLPIYLRAYADILHALGVGGFRDESFQVDGLDYGDEHFTCFQFDYDFRRDNVENARRLHHFILEKRAYVLDELRRRYGSVDEDLKFDVIAHSMGGLILRYYLRYGDANLPADGSPPELTWAGARHVGRAVLVATPNAGATRALSQLVDGRQFVGPIVGPRYEAALLGTHPSMFELLPRVRHGAVVEEGSGRKLDFMDPELWEKLGWGLADPEQDEVLQVLLPDVGDAGERRAIALDHLRKSLRRAARFHAALDVSSSPPPGTELYLMAGDAVATAAVLAVDPDGGLRVAEEAPGDGEVLRSSALLDERVGQIWQAGLRSPIAWTHVTFLARGHLGITRDPVFTDNLLYLLLEAPRG